jgi:D-aminoacyl-tRNA deacylase
VGNKSLIGLIQRAESATVAVGGKIVAEIGQGLVVLIGVLAADTAADSDRLLQRLLDYRVFDDGGGRMNHSLVDVQGGLLLVPQFTLAAETRKGTRPGFSRAAPPAQGLALFLHLVAAARASHSKVASGVFGAHMQLSLINDGPVTVWLES